MSPISGHSRERTPEPHGRGERQRRTERPQKRIHIGERATERLCPGQRGARPSPGRSSPRGTKNPLHIVGWEEWDIDAEWKIIASRGWFDAVDYARQVARR